MGIEGFTPKKAPFKALLTSGRKVNLVLRAFTLADQAWFQQEFTEEKLVKLSELQPTEACEAIWHMLTSESKKTFSKVKFVDFDEEKGCEIEIELQGYEKLLHSFTEEAMLAGYEALGVSRGLNAFMNDIKKKMKTH